MQVFQQALLPARFHQLQKYFVGIAWSELDVNYPYPELVETEDKLLMLVFYETYIKRDSPHSRLIKLQVIEQMLLPTRFHRLQKYFVGMAWSDLDVNYPYPELVKAEDKLLMRVFYDVFIKELPFPENLKHEFPPQPEADA